MPKKTDTRTRYVVRQIMPADGWQAVYWLDDHHESWPIYALGLGYEVVRGTSTGRVVPSSGYPWPGATVEEEWEIYGLDYSMGDGYWIACNEHGNFCGLMTPGTTLEAWSAAGGCAYGHRKEAAHA